MHAEQASVFIAMLQTSVRMTTVTDKLKDMPSLKRVSQTNPVSYHLLHHVDVYAELLIVLWGSVHIY